MSKSLLAMSGLLVIGAAISFAAGAKDKEQKGEERDDAESVVGLDKLPKAARDALTRLAGDARIEEVTAEDEDGVKVYEGSWQIKGVEHEAEVTETGDVVETEEEVGWDAVPKAVQQAATKSYPKGTKVTVEKKTIVLYELEAEIGGREKEFLVNPAGERVEIEDEGDED